MEVLKIFKNRCFNPFNYKNHGKSSDLRPVSQALQTKFNIDAGLRICSLCRKKIQHSEPTFIRKLCDKKRDQDNINPEESVENDIDLDRSGFESVSSSAATCIVSTDFDQTENIKANANAVQRTQTLSQKTVSSVSSSQFQDVSISSSYSSGLSLDTKLPVINKALGMLDCSPVEKKRVRYDSYVQEKAHQLSSNLTKSVGACHLQTEFVADEKDDARHFRELVAKLKAKFHSNETEREEKLKILTLLPHDWSAEKIAKKMETSVWMAGASKRLIERKGILSLPDPKQGKKMSENVKKIVLDFFNDERNSSTMPGKKDYLSVRNETGKRTYVQKKLILSNLKELYKSFQSEHPAMKIGFSTFAAMRPIHCILAGASGTHTVCVCSTHQNIKLMIAGCGLKQLTEYTELPIVSYQDCINAVVCSEATDDCHLGNCSNCPKKDLLKDFLNQVFWDNEISRVTFKQWVTKPRTTLETIVQDSSDFIQEFCEKTQNLLRHAFIAKSQGNFFKNLKNSLTEEEALVIIDFAENYAFVIQDAAPGYHWNNAQATLYTVVVYFKDFHKSLVVLSDNTNHDAIAVHIYNKIVIDYIKSISDNIKKTYYFSDGAPQQFKNYKNIANLCRHEKNYGMVAEWHFFATAHGKGPCDGVGGILKREAARASLRRHIDNQITTVKELYEWASDIKNLPNIAVKYSIADFYKNELPTIEKTFENIGKVKNLQRAHCLIPKADGTVVVKEYSSSSSSKIYRILPQKK